MYPIGNGGHCHTDSNPRCVQCIRRETRTTVIPILILAVFSVSAGNDIQLPYRFKFSRYQVYPMANDDHCHTDSNSYCIQCILLEMEATVIPILILAVFSVSDGKRGPFTYHF